jgi:hypothetical protein
VIEAKQTAETFATLDRGCHVFVRWRDDEATFKPLMWTFPIVVRNVLSNLKPQMTFAKQDEPA